MSHSSFPEQGPTREARHAGSELPREREGGAPSPPQGSLFSNLGQGQGGGWVTASLTPSTLAPSAAKFTRRPLVCHTPIANHMVGCHVWEGFLVAAPCSAYESGLPAAHHNHHAGPPCRTTQPPTGEAAHSTQRHCIFSLKIISALKTKLSIFYMVGTYTTPGPHPSHSEPVGV